VIEPAENHILGDFELRPLPEQLRCDRHTRVSEIGSEIKASRWI
jgi:hypothetical protein